MALDDVIVDGFTAANVRASFAAVTLGPGPVNFTPSVIAALLIIVPAAARGAPAARAP